MTVTSHCFELVGLGEWEAALQVGCHIRYTFADHGLTPEYALRVQQLVEA